MRLRAVAAAVLCWALALPGLADNAADTHAVAVYRVGLLSIIEHLDAKPLQNVEGVVPAPERAAARILWRSFLDYQLALDAVRANHAPSLRKASLDAESLLVYQAAMLAQYRTALALIERAERAPVWHAILNEAVPELATPKNTYADFKFRWLNVARAAELSAFEIVRRAKPSRRTTTEMILETMIADDAQAVWRAGQGQGPKQTMRNAVKVVQTSLWSPVPAGLRVAAGGDDPAPPRPPYVSQAQIARLQQHIQPGDVIYERREWALTNIGLPGFWPHIALYVGTPDERRRVFGDAFEARLRERYPAAYARHLAEPGVIEAVGRGVIPNKLTHSVHADYVAVLRPRVDAPTKAAAIERAFAFLGRPYDFDFDFQTDDAIVCTELVFKAYEPAIPFPVGEVAGRRVAPPNDWVRWFDETLDRPERPFDLLLWFDGDAARGTARESDAAAFRKSWRRPKWHSAAQKMK